MKQDEIHLILASVFYKLSIWECRSIMNLMQTVQDLAVSAYHLSMAEQL